MSIGIRFTGREGDRLTPGELSGKSKWWGAPDLPVFVDYPTDDEGNPLTFVCQIRLEDLNGLPDAELLPGRGMLYFFAAIGEYIPALDGDSAGHNGIGEWSGDAFRVLYSPVTEGLEPFEILYEDDDTPAYLPAEGITFEAAADAYDSFKLLGTPYYEEISSELPGYMNLLQIDENDDWGLTLYDCGMICFLIRPEDLRDLRLDRVKVYFHSF